MNILLTSFDAGKNCIPDGSGSYSATVEQLEILPLTHIPNIGYYSCSISVIKMFYQSYIVIVQNGTVSSSYMLSGSSNFTMLLLVKKCCMFIHAALNLNYR